MVLTCPEAQSHVAVMVTGPAMPEADRQTDPLMADTALWVTDSRECLVPLQGRKSPVLEELCHQVNKLQEDASRLHSIQVNCLFSEML